MGNEAAAAVTPAAATASTTPNTTTSTPETKTGEAAKAVEQSTAERIYDHKDSKETTGKAVESKETKTETKQEKTVVPETYDLKLPEGSFLSKQRVEKIAALAKERGLSPEQAQAALDTEHAAVADYVMGSQTQIKTIQDSWVKTANEDKEIGGSDFKKNVELSKRVLDRFGTPELKKALEETQYGNHPELLRVFTRIGKAMAEDQLVKGTPVAPEKKSAAEAFYPNQKGK